MKTTAKYTAIIMGMILLLTSCSTQLSIQKRRYSSGFNVELVNGKQQKLKNNEAEPKQERQVSIDTIQVADNSAITGNDEMIEEECGMGLAVNEIKSIKKIDVEKTIKYAPVIKNLMNIKCGGLMKYSGGYEDDDDKDLHIFILFIDILFMGLYLFLGLQLLTLAVSLIYLFVLSTIIFAFTRSSFNKNKNSVFHTILFSLFFALLILLYFSIMSVTGHSFMNALFILFLVAIILILIISKIISILNESGGCWGG